MINDLNRWTVGWIDWNLLLDEQGGPNHVGNFCSAPLLADPAEDGCTRRARSPPSATSRASCEPGAQRVLCAATREALECTAFANPDGSVAVVVLNRSEHDLAFSLAIDGTPTRPTCRRTPSPPSAAADRAA
jgi:glucosylceramidase